MKDKKECLNCKKELPFYFFDKDRYGLMGLKKVCRNCVRKT